MLGLPKVHFIKGSFYVNGFLPYQCYGILCIKYCNTFVPMVDYSENSSF